MIGTPSNLELLLHCYYSAEPHPRYSAPAIQQGLEYLRDQAMIAPTSPGAMRHNVTEKGRAFIEYLMTVPFPTQHWIVENGQ